jgi:hypothetical protein
LPIWVWVTASRRRTASALLAPLPLEPCTEVVLAVDSAVVALPAALAR